MVMSRKVHQNLEIQIEEKGFAKSSESCVIFSVLIQEKYMNLFLN